MATLNKGDKAPDFELKDQNEKNVSLTDFSGKKVLVYFYPKASTSGCTAQACNVRDAMAEFQRLQVVTIGISPDEPDKQKKFDEKNSLGFPLLSDPDHKVAQAYGVWGMKKMYGKEYEGIIRSSFLVDEDGKILDVWYKVSPKDTVPKAMETLQAQ